MRRLISFTGFLPYLIVVFLNAFIDLGHKIIIQNTVFKIYDGQQQIILTAIVNALILLPFILLLSPAGFVSDRFPRNKVIRVTSWGAVLLTLCITLFYYLGWFWPAFAMTFMLALQSAFYSPAKYGFIKELVGSDNLAQANGVVQATTTIAILSGIFAFTVLFEVQLKGVNYSGTDELLQAIAPVGWLLVLFSVIELKIAYQLPLRQAVEPELEFDFRQYSSGHYLKKNTRVVFQNRIIYLSIFGLSLFWAISQVMLAAFPAYAKDTLSINNTIIIQGAMACAGFGIMLGAVIAGRISDERIETGILPVGAIGIGVCILVLPYLMNPYLQAINFLFWGMCGGLLLTPYNALIQYHAPNDELGRILAGNNFFQNITMLVFLVMTVVFALSGINSEGLFWILLFVALFGALPIALLTRKRTMQTSIS